MLTLALVVPASGGPRHALRGAKLISAKPTADLFAKARFSRPLVIDNQWTPMIPGRKFVLAGVVRDGKRLLRHRIESIVTDMKKVIDGIPCVVILENDYSAGKLEESELFFVAQDDNRNVWLFGEYPELFTSGRFQGAPDTWVAPTFGTQPGIFFYESPRMGAGYSQGFAPHIKFYDRARVLRRGLRICVPAGCFGRVVEVDEFGPYAPSDRHQRKYYAPGMGTILATHPGRVGPLQETVSLRKIARLNARALGAVRTAVLASERRAYKTSDAYRQTPRMTRR